MPCNIILPAKWVDSSEFEKAYVKAFQSTQDLSLLSVHFPTGCAVMIDAALRILSLVAYSLHHGGNVTLNFEDPDGGAMGYLNRVGFFDILPDNGSLVITPERPIFSSAKLYKGNNPGTVEIGHVDIGNIDHALPKNLASAIAINKIVTKSVEDDLWLILAELIQNIPDHSQSPTGGYAAFQAYTGGAKIQVAVSDNGLGALATLRPALISMRAPSASLSDIDLLLEIFRKGISRHGGGRGHGLKRSAETAVKYKALMDIRLATSRMVLKPSNDVYTPHAAHCQQNLPMLPGTHLCFTFPLDSSR